MMLNVIVPACPNEECDNKNFAYKGGEDGVGVCPKCNAFYPINDSDLLLVDRSGNKIDVIPSEETLDSYGMSR